MGLHDTVWGRSLALDGNVLVVIGIWRSKMDVSHRIKVYERHLTSTSPRHIIWRLRWELVGGEEYTAWNNVCASKNLVFTSIKHADDSNDHGAVYVHDLDDYMS